MTSAINHENGANTILQYTADRPDRWSEYGLVLPNGVIIQSNLTLARDAFGRILSIALYISGSNQVAIPYTYDVDNLMLTAGDLQIGRSSDNGLVSGTQLGYIGDGYSYNNFGEVIGYTSAAYSYSLQRDLLGRISQKVETTVDGAFTYSYFYDSNDRLSRVDKNGVMTSQYSFDGNGNRISMITNGQTVAALFDNQDRIQQQGPTQYIFNSEGELQQKIKGTNITKYQYGLFGQLRSVQLPNGQIISYDINGLGLRIGKRIDGVFKSYYQWHSPTQISAEVGPTGSVISRFIYGTQAHSPDYMIKNGISYRFIKDHLGSVRFVVSAVDGSIVQRIDYDDWGNVVQDTSPGFQPFGFAGGMYDPDTGLVRFGARDYDAETGRWTSKDPILFNGGDTNLFGYVQNDPVNWIDQEGTTKSKPGQVVNNDGLSGGGGPATIPSGSIVYVAPNGQAAIAPRGSVVSTANNGAGLKITPPGSQCGGGVTRLMQPNGMSPNGYGTMQNMNGQYIDALGNPVQSNSPAAHIQPTFPWKGW